MTSKLLWHRLLRYAIYPSVFQPWGTIKAARQKSEDKESSMIPCLLLLLTSVLSGYKETAGQYLEAFSVPKATCNIHPSKPWILILAYTPMLPLCFLAPEELNTVSTGSLPPPLLGQLRKSVLDSRQPSGEWEETGLREDRCHSEKE